MDAAKQIKPVQKHDTLALASFALGLLSLIFPILATVFLVTANGGPGYLQSLFCGVPFALTGLLSGILSIIQSRRVKRKTDWMEAWGIILAAAVYVISCIMVYVLFRPFLMGSAH